MRILLDTHMLLWVITNDRRLSDSARQLIGDSSNEIFYSVISVWEVEIKHERHPVQMPVSGKKLAEYAEQSGFLYTGIGVKEIDYLKNLKRREQTPDHHDPFDRMLICQAAVNEMMLLTDDGKIAAYTNPCILPA